MNDNINQIRAFIVNNFLFGDGSSLKDDISFLDSGIIDSTGILELVHFLEETYQIKILDNELVPDNFDSVLKIAKYLETKRSCAA